VTTTTATLVAGGAVSVWTNVIVDGIVTRIETVIEILQVDGNEVLVAITPPPANLEIITRKGPG
jgi:hypothetical protein